MAEDSDRALPSKRKPDLNAGDSPPSKAPKSNGDGDSHSINGSEKPPVSVSPVRSVGFDFGEDDEEEDEDYAEEEEEDGEGEGAVDLKGKGVLKGDDKGKGKLFFDEDDDSEDDLDSSDSSDDDGDVQSGSDNEWAEDPLAEVDLDNILPSRTRRRRPMPGLVIDGDRRRNSDGSTT